VMVGDDEADQVWGESAPHAIRELLPRPESLVVKHGERGATLIERDRDTAIDRPAIFEPALQVDVVEPVGAGDAFAAGFLAATLAGDEPQRRLRAGHLRAAGALRTHGDLGDPLPAGLVAKLLDADERTWAQTRITRNEGPRLGSWARVWIAPSRWWSTSRAAGKRSTSWPRRSACTSRPCSACYAPWKRIGSCSARARTTTGWARRCSTWRSSRWT